MILRTLILVLMAASALAQTSEMPPPLRGETLDGGKFSLATGKPTLLVLGFSKKAGDVSVPWRDHFSADFGADPHASYFVVAFLESAPSLVRGMIKSAMRSGTPPAQRSHVLVVTSGEAPWKMFAHPQDDKLPCILLVDATGHVRFVYAGEFTASHYNELKDAASALLKP